MVVYDLPTGWHKRDDIRNCKFQIVRLEVWSLSHSIHQFLCSDAHRPVVVVAFRHCLRLSDCLAVSGSTHATHIQHIYSRPATAASTSSTTLAIRGVGAASAAAAAAEGVYMVTYLDIVYTLRSTIARIIGVGN